MHMKDLWKQFKSLTGYSQVDVADTFNITRQYVSTEINNTSQKHKSTVAFWICVMLDKKIEELENNILQMKNLKSDIYKNVIFDKE